MLTSKGGNSAEKLHNPTSDFSIFDCLHYRLRASLHLLVINLKSNGQYIISLTIYDINIQVLPKQKDKYLMAEKKLRIQ